MTQPSSSPFTLDPSRNPFTSSSVQRPSAAPLPPASSSTLSSASLNQASDGHQFQACCARQHRGDAAEKRGDACVPVKSPVKSAASEVMELFSPLGERNFERAKQVHEWVEFLGEENKWIYTTRSQDKAGSWMYHDRQATVEEVIEFRRKGWPYLR